jgi:hypothetical protein
MPTRANRPKRIYEIGSLACPVVEAKACQMVGPDVLKDMQDALSG